MKKLKKTLIALLAAVITLTALAPCGILSAASGSAGVFSRFDALRGSLLAGEISELPDDPLAGAQERSVLAFRRGTDKQKAYEMLQKLGAFRPLAFTDQLVFAVGVAAERARAVCGGSLLYCVPDDFCDVSLCEAAEIPPELTAIHAPGSPSGGEGVVIAVLDSGVDRADPRLAGAHILPGWDAVGGGGEVVSDEAGHGTVICRIICGENYGVARGASVLPVRITSDGKKIKTSHLVESLYYAADSGADIINMSFGGYIQNAAESEAVAYAAQKGCVLVASAGNEGADPEFAGKYAYPASFENVISVASFGRNGGLSSFSQYNDKVDICAPGEGLALGEDGALIDGTSFSTAYVSAAAALCIEKRGEKIDSAHFEKLLQYACASVRGESDGWGDLDIEKLLACADMPYVEGVCNGGCYFSELSAVFGDCTARLDGEPYESGDVIFSQGAHTLTVADTRGEVTFEFFVDTLPLTYSTEKGDGWVAFVFERGTALLDGEKYVSGTRVTRRGDHVFELTGPYGNKTGTAFSISGTLPAVFGVRDGGVYSEPVEIAAVGAGKTYIDGVEFFGRTCVYANGNHTVKVSDITGEYSREIEFSLKNAPEQRIGVLPAGRAFFDNENGYVALWEPGGSAITLYTPEDLTTPLRELTFEGAVIDMFRENGSVYAVHTRGWRVFDRADILFGEGDSGEYSIEGESAVTACVYGGEVFYADESGYVHRGASDPAPLDLGSRSVLLCPASDRVLAYSAYIPGSIYEYTANAWTRRALASEPGYFGLSASDECVCVGNDIYADGEYGSVRCRLPETERIIGCRADAVITTTGVYNALTGERLGSYPSLVSSVCFDTGIVVTVDPELVYSVSASGGLYGSARAVSAIVGEPVSIDEFTFRAEMAENARVADAFPCGDDCVYVILKNDNRLYKLDLSTGALVSAEWLRYLPLKIAAFGDGAAVVFERSDSVYLTQTRDYMEFPLNVTDVCVCEGEVYAVMEGGLWRMPQDVPVKIEGLEGVRQISEYRGAVCAFCGDSAAVYDPAANAVTAEISAEFRSAFAVSEKYVFVGADVFESAGLTPVVTLGEAPSCARSDVAFCESGVYDLTDGKRISSASVSGGKCVITPRFLLAEFTENSLTVTDCTGDISKAPVISGVADGGEYYGEVGISTDIGKLYLDGAAMENGGSVTAVGPHSLRVKLPFGISHTLGFTLLRHPTGIVISRTETELSPGQSFGLAPKLVPSDATGKIVFYSNSPAVKVSAEGRVTAVSYGTALVTAFVEGTDLFTSCTVNVANAAIEFNGGAYSIDRDIGVVSGVLPGTDITRLIADTTDPDAVTAFAADGTALQSGAVRTGTVLQKRSLSGKVTDTLTVAVSGDADRDGRVTVADADILFAHLRGSRVQDGVIAAALDVNGNGKITSSDLKALYRLLEYVSGVPCERAPLAVVPDLVSPGAVFPVYIRAGSLKNESLAGALVYDENELSFVSTAQNISEIFIQNDPGALRFCVPAADRAQGDIMCVYMRAPQGTGSVTLRLTDMSLSGSGTLASPADFAVTVPVIAPAERLEVACANAELEFRRDVYSYSLTVPYGESELLLDISSPAECFVYTSSRALAPEGVTAVTLTYVTPAETFVYTFNAEHGEVRQPDTDNALGGITVTGAALEPQFSPLVHEYTVSAPKDVTVAVSAQANSKYAHVETSTEYGKDGITYRFVCTPESGEAAEYTVRVIYEQAASHVSASDTDSSAPEESSSALAEESVPAVTEESVEDPSNSDPAQKEKGGKAVWLLYAALAFVILIAACAVVTVRRRSGK